jgi:hypothetical protein
MGMEGDPPVHHGSMRPGQECHHSAENEQTQPKTIRQKKPHAGMAPTYRRYVTASLISGRVGRHCLYTQVHFLSFVVCWGTLDIRQVAANARQDTARSRWTRWHQDGAVRWVRRPRRLHDRLARRPGSSCKVAARPSHAELLMVDHSRLMRSCWHAACRHA